MSRIRTIWLVARREILERGRTRGYLLSLLFTLLLIGVGFVLPSILAPDRNTLRLAVVSPGPPNLEVTLGAVAIPFDVNIEFVEVPDRAAGEVALSADPPVEAVIDVPADLSGPGEVIVAESAATRVQAIVVNGITALRVNAYLESVGVSAPELAAASTPPAIVALDPPDDSDTAAFIIANAGIILLFIGIFSYGTWVLTGVVEEKQSRVVEVVLATVRPRDLLMGKVLGIGVLAVVQIAILVAAGLGVALAMGQVTLPETTPASIVMLLVWFILGFALYATALGVLGALTTRMEEASNATLPVTAVAMLSYFGSIFLVAEDPGGLAGRILTFLPPSAPMVVPLRSALGAVEAWEVVVAIGITLVAIWGLFVVGGRIYSGAVLQTGAQVRLRDAWRAAER